MSAPAAPGSPPAPAALPSLGVEYPPDHPLSIRRAQAAAAAESARANPQKTAEQAAQEALLSQFSQALSVPNSPAEVARRMSIGPNSRRNSILAIPPFQKDLPPPTDHLPAPGTDLEIDQQEIIKEIEEIDTIG